MGGATDRGSGATAPPGREIIVRFEVRIRDWRKPVIDGRLGDSGSRHVRH